MLSALRGMVAAATTAPSNMRAAAAIKDRSSRGRTRRRQLLSSGGRSGRTRHREHRLGVELIGCSPPSVLAWTLPSPQARPTKAKADILAVRSVIERWGQSHNR